MKKQNAIYKLVIVLILLTLMAGSPSLKTAQAMPETPEDPEAVNLISKPVVVFPGLRRGELDGGDPDIYPPAPKHPNDLGVIGAVPDTTGAVGHTHYLQSVNKSLRLFRKDGLMVDEATINNFWNGASGAYATGTYCDPAYGPNHHGQPYIIYDHLAARWIIVDVAYRWWEVDIGPYYLCVAVSSGTPAPMVTAVGTYLMNPPFPTPANWFYYAIPVIGPGAQYFYPSNPKLGLWPDGIYISADLYDLFNNGYSRLPRGAMAWAVNRSQVEGGVFPPSSIDVIPVFFYEGRGFEHLVPTNLLGQAPSSNVPNYYATIEPGRFRMWEFRVDWSNLSYTFGVGTNHDPNVTINTDTSGIWAQGHIVPQPGTSEQVEAMGYRLTSPLQYRIVDGVPSIWTSHTVLNGGVTGLRWYEMQFAQDGTPFFYQTGTFNPSDGNFRWLPSLAVDKRGNMAIGYNLGNSIWPFDAARTRFPSIYYTGRLRSDVPGALPQGEWPLDLPNPLLPPFNATQYDFDGVPDGPWGRQAQMTVDPANDCVFWFTSMYYSDFPVDGAWNGYDWYTRIGAFTFPECRTGQLRRVSLHTNNTEGNNSSGMDAEMYSNAISENGRYVVFSSDATNLINGDTNGWRDVFLRDRDTDGDGLYDEPGAVRTMRLPFRTTDGTGQPNGASLEVSISANGRWVAFSSYASNFQTGDLLGNKDIYVFDRDYDNDGTFDEAGPLDTYIRRVSVPDGTFNGDAHGDSRNPFISGNGRFVAYSSNAPDMDTTPVDTNGRYDIYIHDRDTDADGLFDELGFVDTERVSFSSFSLPAPDGDYQLTDDSQHPTLSDDGRFLAFSTYAMDFAALNFAGDANAALLDVLIRDLWFGDNMLMSVQTGSVAQGNAASYTPYISGNGQFVVFASQANNLVVLPPDLNGFADIFMASNGLFGYYPPLLLPWVHPTTSMVSVSYSGVPGNGDSYTPSISRAGDVIAFASDASNLDAFLPDLNGVRDIYLHDLRNTLGGITTFGMTSRISLDAFLGEPNDRSFAPIVAPLGRYVSFVSEASDLVLNDFNFVYDVFAYDGEASTPVFLTIVGNSVPAPVGSLVDVDVVFEDNNYSIDSFAFSIDFDERCLSYEGVVFSLPPNFFGDLNPTLWQTDSELDVSIMSMPDPLHMPDGTLLTLTFRVLASCNSWDGSLNAARVAFSRNPRPSFGSHGQSVIGLTVDGFVKIGAGLPGDCNGNGIVEAADFEAVVLEIFDGDGNLPENTPNPTFFGNPVGCNPNFDNTVDAGDISCTIDIYFHGPAAACVSSALDPLVVADPAGPIALSLPSKTTAKAGGKVYLPINLATGGNPVSSLTFSINYDQTWLSYDKVIWSVPTGWTVGASHNGGDTDGEIDVVLYNKTSTTAYLPSAPIGTLVLNVGNPPGQFLANLVTSNEPLASFGSNTGASLPGSFTGGQVWINLLNRMFYLPFIRR